GAGGRKCVTRRGFLPIKDDYPLRCGNINENPCPGLPQRERFRMPLHFDLAAFIPSRSINNAEPAAPITDIDTVGGCIVSNVIGVIGKLYALDELERRSIEHVAGTALTIGDKNLVELGNETNTLRLMQPGD